ncbi:MAG: hypothetical protein ABIN69_15715 [Aestuariivirga sp.]
MAGGVAENADWPPAKRQTINPRIFAALFLKAMNKLGTTLTWTQDDADYK